MAARLPGERDHTSRPSVPRGAGGARVARRRCPHGERARARADATAPSRPGGLSGARLPPRPIRADAPPRLTDLACTRLRERHRALAGDAPGSVGGSDRVAGRGRPPPEAAYLLRLPFFRDYDAADLEAAARRRLGRASGARRVARRRGRARASALRDLERRRRGGDPPRRLRDSRRACRPGPRFRLRGLIAGGDATAAAAARERSVVLVVSPPSFKRSWGSRASLRPSSATSSPRSARPSDRRRNSLLPLSSNRGGFGRLTFRAISGACVVVA